MGLFDSILPKPLPPEEDKPAPPGGFPRPPSTDADVIPFPAPDVPSPGAPPEVEFPAVETPGFGPIVPDTTKGVTAADSPGALFTADNMEAERAAGFLQRYVDRAGGVQPEETVSGQLETILNQDNPLWDWARGEARQYANTRGLINSSIAAEATGQAVMGAALPIAAANAQVYAERAAQERGFWYTAGLQAFDATIQSGLMAQDHLQRMVQMSHQGDINSRLQLEQFGYNWQLNEQQNLHAMQLASLQGDIQAKLALQKFGFDTALLEQDFGYRVKLSDLSLRNALRISRQDHRQAIDRINATHANTLAQIAAQADVSSRLANEGFAQQLQGQYLGATERATSEFNQEIASIQTQEGVTAAAKQRAINDAFRRYQNRLAMLAEQYSSSPFWDSSWEVTAGAGGPPTASPIVPFPPTTQPFFPNIPLPPGVPPTTLPFQPPPPDVIPFVPPNIDGGGTLPFQPPPPTPITPPPTIQPPPPVTPPPTPITPPPTPITPPPTPFVPPDIAEPPPPIPFQPPPPTIRPRFREMDRIRFR